MEIFDQIQILRTQKVQGSPGMNFVPEMIHIFTLTYSKIIPRFSALFELYVACFLDPMFTKIGLTQNV